MSGFTREQRRQAEELMKRLRPEIQAAVKRALSDERMTNERVPTDNSVDGDKLQSGAVGNGHIKKGAENADRAIEGAHIKRGELKGEHLEDGTIGGGKLANNYAADNHGHGNQEQWVIDLKNNLDHKHPYIKTSDITYDGQGYLQDKSRAEA